MLPARSLRTTMVREWNTGETRAVEDDLASLRQALGGKIRPQRKGEGGEYGSCFHCVSFVLHVATFVMGLTVARSLGD